MLTPDARKYDGPFVLWTQAQHGSRSAFQSPPDPEDEELHNHQEGSHGCVAGDGKLDHVVGVAGMGRLAHSTLQQVPTQPACTRHLVSVHCIKCPHLCPGLFVDIILAWLHFTLWQMILPVVPVHRARPLLLCSFRMLDRSGLVFRIFQTEDVAGMAGLQEALARLPA